MTENPFTDELDYLDIRIEVVLPPKAIDPNVSRSSLKLNIRQLEYVNDYLRDGQVAHIVEFALSQASQQVIEKVREVERGTER